MIVVQTYIGCIEANWRNFGRELGVPEEKLPVIEYRYVGSDSGCFKAVLEMWLRQDLPTMLPPTWSTLVRVLKAPSLGYNLLAKGIALRFGPQDAAS